MNASGELKDKVILVTGATRGIGEAIVHVLAREGAHVVASSIEAQRATELAATLPGGEKRHLGLELDVTDEAQRARAFDLIQGRFGRLDGLVNNAGANFSKPFTETTLGQWRRLFDINLDSVFDLSRRAIDLFLAQAPQGGSIVNVSSVHTLATLPGAAPYAATKGAMNMLTKGLATEFSSRNIRVNAVAPGLVKTEVWKSIVDDFGGDEEACLCYWRKNIPAGDIIAPEAIAEVVSFALSDRARAMSGSILYVDGGMTSQLIATR